MADWRTTFYAPGAGGNMEGPFATSRKNPITGGFEPFTLDDVRLGRSPWVTVASDPSRYGQTLNLGSVTYRSPIDNQSYTLPNVQGYVHDTGSAFQGRPDKLDIAQGDFRGWNPAAASAYVAGGNAASPEGRPTMPSNSLIDMLQPQQPQSFTDRLGGMSNSLIGLGMGLLQPTNPWAGTNAWTNALRGYAAGAQADQSAAEDARNFAFRQQQARLAQANFERTAGRLEQSPADQMIADLRKYAGTPQEADVRAFYAKQTGGQWALQDIGVDQWNRPIKKWVNNVTQEIRDINNPPAGAVAAAGVGGGAVPYTGNAPFSAGTNPPQAGAAAPGGGGTLNAPPVITTPDGRVVPLPPGMDAKTAATHATTSAVDALTGKYTGEQAKAQLFANRMEISKRILDQTDKNGTPIDVQGTSIIGGGIERMPGSDRLMFGNLLQTPQYQAYRQAKDSFINALLRNESGAAINTGEYVRIDREMFPQPGDSAQTVAAKRQLRDAALQGMIRSAGPGYRSPATVSDQPQANRSGAGGSSPADALRQELIRRGVNPD